MNIWHKRLLYAQILIMLILSARQFFPYNETNWIFAFIGIFLILQMVILVAKSDENPQAVFYKPSCVIALIDSISIFLFVSIGFFKIITIINGDNFWINPIILSVLFLYIASRKYYIMKNYSYEK